MAMITLVDDPRLGPHDASIEGSELSLWSSRPVMAVLILSLAPLCWAMTSRCYLPPANKKSQPWRMPHTPRRLGPGRNGTEKPFL